MADTTYRKLGLEWCKKDEIRPSHSILLVTKLVEIPIGAISHALTCTKHLSGLVSVSFRDDEEQDVTFLLCDLDRPASLIGLGSEIRLDISGLIVPCHIVRLERSLVSSKIERMRVCDITDSDREWYLRNCTSEWVEESKASNVEQVSTCNLTNSDLKSCWPNSTSKQVEEAKAKRQSHRPVVQSQRPVIQSQRPVIQSHRPVIQSHRPVVQSQRPVIQSQRPVIQSHRPVIQSQRPVIQSHRPSHSGPQAHQTLQVQTKQKAEARGSQNFKRNHG